MRLRRLGALLEFWQVRQKGRHMAKRVIHELVDDINGQPADESINFGLDGVPNTAV